MEVWWIFGSLCLAYLAWLWRTFLRGGKASALHAIRDDHSGNALALLYWATPVFFVSLWGWASSSGFVSANAIPSPGDFLDSSWQLIVSGELFTEAWASIRRVLLGFSFAAMIGTAIGLVGGAFLVARQIVGPVVSFMRYIPPTAFVVLMIVYFGVGEVYKYAVVFAGVIFFIIQMVIDVVDDVDRRHIEMAISSGFSRHEIFKKVIVPSSLPRIADVLRINLSAAWTFLVAAELIGADSGLGHLIAVSQRFMRLGDLFVGIVCFGLIGLATDRTIEWANRRCFRWHYVSLRR